MIFDDHFGFANGTYHSRRSRRFDGGRSRGKEGNRGVPRPASTANIHRGCSERHRQGKARRSSRNARGCTSGMLRRVETDPKSERAADPKRRSTPCVRSRDSNEPGDQITSLPDRNITKPYLLYAAFTYNSFHSLSVRQALYRYKQSTASIRTVRQLTYSSESSSYYSQ